MANAKRDRSSTVAYAQMGFKIREVRDGRALVEAEVGPNTINAIGTFHGGAMCFLVDEAGTLAIASADREGRHGVTTDLNLTCLKAVPSGRIVAEARVLRGGRTMAYVSVDLRNDRGELVAQGRMSKYLNLPPS